jgi:Tfp pilus assembly protein PilN
MSESLNLSRRPYVNSRPVVRTALLLWTVGGLLLLGNVFLFWSYLSGSSEKRAELAGLKVEVERQQKVVSDLEGRLDQLDLGKQNEQVAFLNRKIAERTFSWSLLFDRLAEVLPDGVRLIQLQPAAIAADDRPGSRPVPSTTLRGRRVSGGMGTSDRVPLIIQAESKSDEAQYEFVDKLFAHPAFDDPDITRETRDEDNQNRLRFDVRVIYIPAGEPQQVTVEEAPVVEEAPAPSATPPASPTADAGTGIE